MPDTRTCHYCGVAAGRGNDELRPYGPGGANVCFACAMATPERRAQAEAAMEANMAAAEAASPHGVAVIGVDLPPSPLVLPGDEDADPDEA